MKVKLPKPFYTARVTEALSTLTNYIGDGYRIATEIKPLQSSGGTLADDPDTIPKGPHLLECVPNGQKTQPTKLASFITSTGFTSWSVYTALTGDKKTEVDKILKELTRLESPPTTNKQVVLVVSGENLKHVTGFALIPADNLGDASYTAVNVFASNSLVFAVIKTKTGKLPPRIYHAWAQDSYGQEDLLMDALIL